MVSINSFRAADYAVLGISGAVTLAAGLTAIYSLPWRCCKWQRYEPFNTFWRGKIVLEFILGLWAALQILRLPLLWGPYSIVAPDSVTDWTSDGWLCRIYLTAALGIAAPLSSWFFLFLLAAGKADTKRSTLSLADKYHYTTQQLQYNSTLSISPQMILHGDNASHYNGGTIQRETPSMTAARNRRGGGGGDYGGDGSGSGSGHRRSSSRRSGVHKRVGRAFLFALLCTIPITLLQAGAAWVSYWVEYEGVEIEREPRTLIGYFLAVFWYGTPTQCDTNTTPGTDTSSTNTGTPDSTNANYMANNSTNTILDSTATASQQECTLCTFPAASAIIHLLWTFIFLFVLWTTTARIAAAALNRALQKRLRLLVALYTLFAGIGCACLGVSVVEGPFTWVNQAVWLGYVATVAATALLLSWEVVIVPVHSSHVAARRALEWQEGDSEGQMTYAQAVVASPDFPPYSYPYPYPNPNSSQQQQQQQQLQTLSSNASSGGRDDDGINGYEASAPPPFPPHPPVPPYCQVELATHPPISATTRKSRPRLFSRSSRASSRMGSEDGGDDRNLITARDVLVDGGSVVSVGGGTIPTLPSPFMTPQHRQQQLQLYTRSESPGGGGSIPALYNRYYSSGNTTVAGGIPGHHFAYRPSSAASSTAGSVGNGMLGQGRSSWPNPPSPRSAAAAGEGGSTSSVAALHLASYYQPHWQQQQRGSASAASHRPSTASSSAPPSTVSPVYQSYGGAGGGSARINYTSTGTAGGAHAGGLGLGLFGYGLGAGGGGGRYHDRHPSSSFGRAQEAALGTPTSSGTATPTSQSTQQLVPPPPPPWR